MMKRDKMKNAMVAINAVIVRARFLAHENAPHDQIAKVLDAAELLPMLVIRDADMTSQFRNQLEGLCELDKGCRVALQKFDADDPTSPFAKK